MVKLNPMVETFQDSTYKENLTNNFKVIEESLNNIESHINELEEKIKEDNSKDNFVTKDYIDKCFDELNKRIKYITVTGIDETVIRDVVDKILKEKGAI